MFIVWLCLVWLGLCVPMQAQEPSVPKLTFQEALQQVLAQHPELASSRLRVDAARAWGLEGQVGALVVGLDGDCVVWDGPPFEATSRVTAVVVRGRVVEVP